MMLGVKEMDTSNENKITIIAVIVAIIVGVVLQIVFKLPLIVSLVGSVFLGMFVGFIVYLIQSFRRKKELKLGNIISIYGLKLNIIHSVSLSQYKVLLIKTLSY